MTPNQLIITLDNEGATGSALVTALEASNSNLAERCLSRRPASETSSSWKPSVEEVDQSIATDGCVPHLMNDGAMGNYIGAKRLFQDQGG